MKGKITNKRVPAGEALAGGRGHHYVEHQAWLLVPPWLALIGLAVAGPVLHLVLAQNVLRLAWGVFALTLATVVLVAFAAWVTKARGPVVRLMAVASVTAAGLWMIVATIVGILVVGVDLVALLVGVILATMANIRRLTRGTGEDQGHQGAQEWAELASDIKTFRGKIHSARTVGATKKIRMELPPDVTVQDVQQELPRVAQVMRMQANGARVTQDPDDAAMVEMTLAPVDVLKETIPWPGPSAPGRSIALPVCFGDYEDGLPLELTLSGKRGKSPMSHIVIVGMTGAGKSEVIQILVGEAGTRIDVVIDYIDVAGKAEQTVGPLRPAIRNLITDKPEAHAYLRRKLAEVPDRARLLASVGMREWAEGAPVPLELVIIDEGASLVSESTDFVEMARLLRSVGVLIVLAQQRITYDQLPTSARANFGTVLCFGVRSARDARETLSTETIEAGASPEAWRNRKPGYLYCEAPSIDPERHAMPARAYLARPEDIQHVLVEASPIRWKPQGSVAVPTPEETRAAASRIMSKALADNGAEAERVDDPDGTDEPGPADAPPAGLAAEMADVDPDAPLRDVPNVDMDQRIGPPDRIPPHTPEQAEAAFEEFLVAFRQETDGAQFQRRDLIAAGVLQATGRKKGWLSGALGRRVDAGLLQRVGDREDGIYAWTPALAGAQRA